MRQWVTVKIRWQLTVDAREQRALRSHASRCADVMLTVRRAGVARTGAPTPGGAPAGGADPRFSYCYQATAAGFGPYCRGRDAEYPWYTDGDSDGVVCES